MSYFQNIPDALVPQDVEPGFFQEYIGLTPLSGFMGKYGTNAAIQIRDISTSMPRGRTVQFPIVDTLDYRNPVIDFDAIEGKEQDIKFYTDTISLNFRRFADKAPTEIYVDKITPMNIFNQLRPQLLSACQRNLVFEIIKGMTGGLYTDTSAQVPVYDRGIFPGLNPGRGAWYANIDAGVTAQNTGTAYNQNGLSVATIRNAHAMAIRGGKDYEYERRMTPLRIATKNGFPRESFALLTTDTMFNSLVLDPEWQAQANRGLLVSSDQPDTVNAGRFKGMIDDIPVYVVPELEEYSITAGGFTSGWSIFMGAQAVGLSWSLHPNFMSRIWDYDSIGMRSAEIRGNKTIMYPSKQDPSGATLAENGIIHIFPRIA
jgi:hypothetical protein